MMKGPDTYATLSSRTISHTLLSLSSSVLLVLMLFLLLTNVAAATGGSWPMERKATYLSFRYSGFNGEAYYGQHGEKLGMQRLGERTLSLYSEYAYSKYVSGIVNMPAFRKLSAQISPESPALSVQSPGDVELGMRAAIWASDVDVFTVTGLLGIPLGEATQIEGLWAGDDEFNQIAKLGYGHSFGSVPLYVIIEAGYNFRSSGYADELHLGAEVGIRPIDLVQLLLRVRSVNSQGNGDLDFAGGSFGFASNNQRYLLYGSELVFWLSDGVGLNLGVYGITEARNMPASTVMNSGISFIIPAPSDH